MDPSFHAQAVRGTLAKELPYLDPYSLGFRVSGSGFRVQGLGFKTLNPTIVNAKP